MTSHTPRPSLAAAILMVAAGVGFHLLIAMGWTVLFFLAASRFVQLRRHALVTGVGYGLFVWVMMNRVVLPLSRVQVPKTFVVSQAIIGALVLVVCIGLPISLGARWFFGEK